mgnify:FL=1
MSLTGNEYHIKFTRVKTNTGFHRQIKLKRVDAPAFVQHGVLHKLQNVNRRFEGDVPKFSISQKIENMQPHTTHGKSVKYTFLAIDNSRKIISNTAWKTALSAETITLTSARLVGDKLTQNLRYNADTSDSCKAVLSAVTTISTANRARKSLIQHKLQRNKYKIYKQSVISSKAQYKAVKNRLQTKKKNLKSVKKQQKLKLNAINSNFKSSSKLSVKRIRVNAHILSKSRKINCKFQIEKDKVNIQKKLYKSKAKLKRLYKPKQIALQGIGAVTSGAVFRASNKIAQNAQDNDFVQAISKAAITARQIKTVKNTVKNHKIAKAEKRPEKLNKRRNKLQQKQNKLNRTRNKKRVNKPKQKSTVKDKTKQIAKSFVNFIGKIFGALAFPTLIIILNFGLIMMLFGSCTANGSFILGTYYCSDYDMAQVIETYTDIAYSYNQDVIQCQGNDWKTGLSRMGIDTSNMPDKPSEFIFGKNRYQNYNPVYDFDAHKLIAFMCAYTYEFGNTSDQNQRWTYKSEYDDVLQDLFDKEYSFEAQYNNSSYWRTCNQFTVYPSNNSFWYCAGAGTTVYNGTTYGYIDFGNEAPPTELMPFTNDHTIHFDLSTGEVKDRNKGYAKSGYYIQNLNYDYTLPSGSKVNSFYHYIVSGSNRYLGFRGADGKFYHKTQLYVNGMSFNYAIAHQDAEKWLGRTTNNRMLIRDFRQEEYVKECKLYTNVKQLCSFDDAIDKMLKEKNPTDANDYTQRLQYYRILACLEPDANGKTPDTYGLHQMFNSSPLLGDFIDADIYNNYGYDMVTWGSNHCSNTIHYGIDITANTGSNVYAVMDAKVDSIDTANHTIVLITANDATFFYEEDKKHTVKVSYTNITVKSGLAVGDTVKTGDCIGKVDNFRHCNMVDNSSADRDYLHMRVEIKYNIVEWSWHDVDPQFLIYRENS